MGAVLKGGAVNGTGSYDDDQIELRLQKLEEERRARVELFLAKLRKEREARIESLARQCPDYAKPHISTREGARSGDVFL